MAQLPSGLPPSPSWVEVLRAAGEQLIGTHFADMPTRVQRNREVLEAILRHLGAAGTVIGSFPVQLERPIVRRIEEELLGKDPYVDAAYRRHCAFAWLFDKLQAGGLIDGRGPTVGRQRYRNLAVRPTAQAVRDANALTGRLTPAIRACFFGSGPLLALPEAALTLVLELVWDESVTLPRLLACLRTAQWGHSHPEHGYLNLYEPLRQVTPGRDQGGNVAAGAAAAAEAAEQDAPLRVYLSDFGQACLNRYRLRCCDAGVLTPGDTAARMFPFHTGPWDPEHPGALAAALGARARDLSEHPDLTFGFQRLVDASRIHALDRYPPAIIAILSGMLRFAPVPDVEADPSHGAPRQGWAWDEIAAPSVAPLPDGRPEALREAEDPEADDGAGWSELANLSYGEVLVGGIRHLERLLSDPPQASPKAAILEETIALRRALGEDLRALGAEAPARLQDLDLLLAYLEWLLRDRPDSAGRRRKLALGTIQALWCGLAAHADACLEEQGLRHLDRDGWIDFTQAVMFLVRRAPKTRRKYRHKVQSLHAYLRAFHSSVDHPIPPVRWAGHATDVPLTLQAYPLIRPWHLAVLHTRLGRNRGDSADRHGPAARLTYGTGMRRIEVLSLTLADAFGGIEPRLEIRRSKTRNGLRNIPLRPVLPGEEREAFWQFVEAARAAGKDASDLLFTRAAGADDQNVQSFVERIADALKRIVGDKRVSFHSLRHAFASLFLLRWFVATYGRQHAGFLGALLDTPWFSEPALAEFRRLFVPENAGADWPGHPLLVLARIMGHSNPEITVNTYIHTMDWLQRLYLDLERGERGEVRLSVDEAAAALGESRSTIYAQFGQLAEEEGIPCREIVQRQIRLLQRERRRGRRPRRGGPPPGSPGAE